MINVRRSKIVISDTDLHGGMSMLIAVKVLQPQHFYSHFELVRPGTTPTQPVTTPRTLVEALPQIVSPREDLELYILDLPIDADRPLQYIQTLTQYTLGKVVWIDHHGHSEYVSKLYEAGIITFLAPTSYEMSLYLPKLYGRVDSEIEKWALIGALADFDESIADKVNTELEIAVAEHLDQYWKFGMNSIEEVKKLTPKYGNVGAKVKYILDKGLTPDKLLEKAKEATQPLPVPENYEVIGDVVMLREPPERPGIQWKLAWKLTCITGAKVAVIPVKVPQPCVIVASNWRIKSEVASIVDEVVQSKGRELGRTPRGHSGALSLPAVSVNEAKELAIELARKISELIESKVYTPKSVRLINEQYVARALHGDFVQLQREISELRATMMELKTLLTRLLNPPEEETE